MNKVEMTDRLAARTGMNKVAARDAVDAVDSVFATIGEALANGDEVRIAGFGTFAARTRPARTGRNPRTGEAISISASKPPSFKAGKALRDRRQTGCRRAGWRTYRRTWQFSRGCEDAVEREPPSRSRAPRPHSARLSLHGRGAGASAALETGAIAPAVRFA